MSRDEEMKQYPPPDDSQGESGAGAHVGELLSGYIDGELTQQQRQKVELHSAQCPQCHQDLQDLQALRERIAGAALSPIGTDQWRENMKDSSVETTRNVGWIMFVLGMVAIGLVLVFGVLLDNGIALGMKVILFAIYGGLAILLYSVLRQRLIERKTDKYKDVEI